MPSTSPPVAEQPLFFLDYDGTLAPIVDVPMQAFPHPDLPDVLKGLLGKFPVWIVTGRDLQALGQLLPVDLPAVGLHGIEWGTVGRVHEARIAPADRDAIRDMRAHVPSSEGIVVEEKGALFAVHYRSSPDPDAAQRILEAWAREAPPSLDVIWGKFVVELRPKGSSKGEVVAELVLRHPDRTPVYLGDDTTDEDAFKVLKGRGVTVKIGQGQTDAEYQLPDVEAVLAYLRQYV